MAHLPLTLRDHDGLAIATTTTDGQGGYRFDRIKPGRYTVDSPTSAPQAVPLAPDTTSANVVLSPAR